MKKPTTLKAFLLSLAMALVVLSPTTMNAQSEDWFRNNDFNGGNRFASDWAIMNLGIGQDADAPLGGGLLVLGVAGAGYAVARRRRSLKKGAAMLAALAMMLGFTQCRKNLETIATAPANGVYITLDVDGGSRVVVNPNGAATYATVKFEAGDIIYVGNNGKYCGHLTHNGTKFAGEITPTSGDDTDYLHFYFMGNKGGESEPTSVSITDQKDKYPVISYGRSTSLYENGVNSYKATLENHCSIVKFITLDVSSDIMITGMHNVVTVDFSANNGETTGNPYSFSKEGNGKIKLHKEAGANRWAILLPQDEVTTATAYGQGIKSENNFTVPAITANTYHADGVKIKLVTSPVIENGFTVDDCGGRVLFSPGNLQATGTTSSTPSGGWTWSFAANQYDFIGAAVANNAINGNGTISSDGTVDLFGWSTASTYYGIHNSLNDADYAGDFKDWGEVANAANLDGHNDWRTLTKDEWNYLLNTRNVNNGQNYNVDYIGDNEILVIYPDGYEGPVYSGRDWTTFENAGCVCLPVANCRNGNQIEQSEYAAYWSSSDIKNQKSGAYATTISGFDVFVGIDNQRSLGSSIRLVRDAN